MRCRGLWIPGVTVWIALADRGRLNPANESRWPVTRGSCRAFLRGLTELVRAGKLKDTVAEEISVDDMPAVLDRLSARQILGKLVVEVDAQCKLS